MIRCSCFDQGDCSLPYICVGIITRQRELKSVRSYNKHHLFPSTETGSSLVHCPVRLKDPQNLPFRVNPGYILVAVSVTYPKLVTSLRMDGATPTLSHAPLRPEQE
jgi:hypothetical protein